MPLNINNGGGGDFTTYVKYNAKAGRWYTKPDEQDAEEYEVANLTAVFDFANIKTGWFMFSAGAAPDKVYDPSLTEAAPRPSDSHKRGFELLVFSDKNLGGLREFSSTAGAVAEGINNLYAQYEEASEAKAGKLPVVKCTGVNPVTNKHGTNYAPVFEIMKWIDRPAELDGAANQNSETKPEPAKATGTDGAAHQPPPANTSSDDEF